MRNAHQQSRSIVVFDDIYTYTHMWIRCYWATHSFSVSEAVAVFSFLHIVAFRFLFIQYIYMPAYVNDRLLQHCSRWYWCLLRARTRSLFIFCCATHEAMKKWKKKLSSRSRTLNNIECVFAHVCTCATHFNFAFAE